MSSYLNNQTMESTISSLPEEEIDLKEIIASLLRYKKSMIGVTLGILLLSIFIALSKTDIYQADLTLQVQDAASQGPGDFMAAALGTQGGNLGNEIAIFKSRFIAKKVLEKVQMGTRYYSTAGLKSVELYKQSPFVVETYGISEKLIGYEFQLNPVDRGHFRLSLKPKLGMKIAAFFGSSSAESMIKMTSYEGVFSYGSIITHGLFKLKVINVGAMGVGEHYAFTITPNDMMYSLIQSSLSIGISAEKGSILTLSYQDNVPQRAQDVLNVIAEVYENQNVKIKSASAEKTLGFIDEQLAAINKGLQKSAFNLKDYKSSHVVIELGAKAGIVANSLSQYETQMYELDMQESMLKSMLSFIKKNKEIRGIDLSGASAPVISLIQKIQELNTLHSSLLVDYTPKHPSVMKVNDQLASLKADLQGTLESSLRGLKQRKTSLQEIIDKHTASFEKLPEEERELAQLNRSFMVNEEIYKFLLQKRAETAIIESSTVSGMRIIDDALINGPAVQPNRVLIVMMGLIIGLIMGVLQAFVRHFKANTIQTIGDLEKHTYLPLYSVLPLFKEKKSLYEDALRVLLTRFEFMETKPKVIAITSSVKGEGRTTTALELAHIISKSGKKVIVLDLDMRESRVNKKLAMTNELGISSFLSGSKTFEDVVRKVTAYLDVVVAGPIPENPYELIISNRLSALLDELRGVYDYIILESPPAGLVADALVLMRLSDLNLIVFKAGYSKKDFIKSTNRFVNEHALSNVALILNALELKKIRPWLRK